MMEDIIRINNVTYKYKGSDNELLSDFNMSVKKGEVLLLCGLSGSGKTTVLRLINGLIPHYYQGDITGSVYVKEYDIKETELYELAGIVGTVFQNPRSQFFSVDTDGEIVFGPENIGINPDEILERKNQAVRDLNIEKLLNRNLFELSGGEKQKIACASVTALLPEIILLDEPSANLDNVATENLSRIIDYWKQQGKTIIISEHRLWYVKDLVDRVLYMENGSVKYEWNGVSFRGLSEKQINELRLRPFNVKNDYFNMSGNSEINDSNKEDESIIFKKYYFCYNKKNKDKKQNLNIDSLTLPKGSVVAVTGRNGTGKSTFLRCICGLEKSCPGIIIADGKKYKKKKKLDLSYMVMQDVNHQLFTDSVMSEVMLSMKDKDEAKCEEILEKLGLLSYKEKHPMALSGGQKQRVAIASAIASGAKLLLFDEPTSGLDYYHMVKVGEMIKKLVSFGITILVSTHDTELIDLCCDYVLCIEDGRVKGLKSVNV